jgi:sec-independent protein translocase protein TatB
MLDIGWSEIMVIAVVAIVVIGPKDLPRAMRVVGQWTNRVKGMARDFQNQFNEAIREAELDSVKRDIDDLTKIDPMADVKRIAGQTEVEIRQGLNKPAAEKPAIDKAPEKPVEKLPEKAPEKLAEVDRPQPDPAAPSADAGQPAARPAVVADIKP